MVEQPKPVDADELEFRKKNQWHSFAGATWGALGGAAFFGLLSMLASAAVGLAAGPEAGYMYNMGSAILSSSTALLTMAGLMTAGVGCVYMSQQEYTELRVLQDEHMAQQQAKCMGVAKSQGLSQEQAQTVCGVSNECEQNQRADGKQWQQVVTAQAQEAVARVH